MKVVPIANGHGVVAVTEPTCTGIGVIEVGCHSFSAPPSVALKGVGYPFIGG